MNTKQSVTKTLFGVTLAVATATSMAGAASAAVPDGTYTAQVYPPLETTMWGLPPLSAPATVRDNILDVAGMTGKLIPTGDGYRVTLSGHQLVLTSVSDDSGDYLISDRRGATLGQLITR
ncbi:hypothetical protein ACFUEJ_10705 [Gordonia sp. NPDC057258]|uniref:hypothetical protein n=1 Tax=unclassified Gordonia (in: high G+C Gram-positive bacteria) TaxID=2657482 RepID=UPI00363C81E5